MEPTGEWMEKNHKTPGPSAIIREDPKESNTEVRVLIGHEREIELYRRVKKLTEREVQLMRKEIELLREAQQLNVTNQGQTAERENVSRDVAKASISAIADLLSYFDSSIGDYEN